MTTFREKMMEDHPEYVNEIWEGGCKDCPGVYYNGGKCIQIDNCGIDRDCAACWDREMPEDGDKKMRFKVGDKVRVREDLEVDKEYGEILFAEDMKRFKGIVCEIEEVNYGSYFLKKTGSYYFTDEMLEPAEFTKSDLRDGMICTTRDGKRWMWLNGRFKTYDKVLTPEYVSENLKHVSTRTLDVIKISVLPEDYSYSIKDILKKTVIGEVIIWKRKEELEPKKMTVKEIEELLGHPVEIISEKI